MLSLIKKLHHRPLRLYLLMVLLGIATGLSNISILNHLSEIITDTFIRIFQLISLPLIALSIIVTISSLPREISFKALWQKTLVYTLTTTIIAAMVSCLLYLLIRPKNVENIPAHLSFNLDQQPAYTQHLASLIPNNIFAPFLEHQAISLLVMSFIIGIALRSLSDQDAKLTTIALFKGLHQIFLTITRWIILILPIAIYGFVVTTIIQLKGNVHLGGIGAYLAIILLANLIQGFVILPIWLKLNHIKPFQMMRQMMPALSVAFFSKSSTGTLPVTIHTAEKELGIHPKLSRFVLPMCTSLNMNGCAAFIFATVIYLMQNQGIAITPVTLCTWIVVATIAAIGNAGIPMGCFFLSASLLSNMNVSIILLGVILPFYNLIDMVETSLNVWSDLCVTRIIHKNTVLSGDYVDLIPSMPVLEKN